MAVWVAIALSAIAGMWGIDAALAVLTAVVLHEVGHALALRAAGKKSASLLLLPALGLIRVEKADVCDLGDRTAITMAGPMFAMMVALIGLAAQLWWPHLHIGGLMTSVILLNCLAVWPVSSFDGTRILASLVRPTTALFYVIQWLTVAVLLGGGVFFKSRLLVSASIVALTLTGLRLKSIWVWRPVIGNLDGPATEIAARVLKFMTAARFESRRAAWRLTQARFLIDTLTSPVALGIERRRIVMAYLALMVFAIAAYRASR
jgi:hypothetical protein